jgi:hypothetical protein
MKTRRKEAFMFQIQIRISIFALIAIFPFNFADAALVADTRKAAQNTLGLVGLYANPSQNGATAGLGDSASTKNYPLKLTSDGNIAYVNVPWVDTNTTYGPGYGINIRDNTIIATGFHDLRNCNGIFKDVTGGTYATIEILCQENPYINTITVSFSMDRIKAIGYSQYSEKLFEIHDDGRKEKYGEIITLFNGKKASMGKYCTTYVYDAKKVLKNVAYSEIVGYSGYPSFLGISWMSSDTTSPDKLTPNIHVMIDCTFMYETEKA